MFNYGFGIFCLVRFLVWCVRSGAFVFGSFLFGTSFVWYVFCLVHLWLIRFCLVHVFFGTCWFDTFLLVHCYIVVWYVDIW